MTTSCLTLTAPPLCCCCINSNAASGSLAPGGPSALSAWSSARLDLPSELAAPTAAPPVAKSYNVGVLERCFCPEADPAEPGPPLELFPPVELDCPPLPICMLATRCRNRSSADEACACPCPCPGPGGGCFLLLGSLTPSLPSPMKRYKSSPPPPRPLTPFDPVEYLFSDSYDPLLKLLLLPLFE